MTTLWLRVRAPFAAFRWLQAGVYRATSPIFPPSAAWGLVLNLAHIDARHAAAGDLVTGVRADAPPLCLAVGQAGSPEVSVLYQQLHSYPVGNSPKGKELAARTRGAKHWIAPVRREILIDLDCVIGVRSPDPAILDRAVRGLSGELDAPRYGLPFAGDNNLLISRIDVLDQPVQARWYIRVTPDSLPPRDSCRLTVAIDRHDNSKSASLLYAPTLPAAEPPAGAWTWCPRAPTGA